MIRRPLASVLFSLSMAAISSNALAADATTANQGKAATAIFAGGCFWCSEADFEKLPGVIGAESGYTAGSKSNPTYEQVSAGGTGHTESVRVSYDPSKLSYAQLVDYFWKHIDPTVKDKQFCDSGSQYRSGIYWQNAEERKIAEKSQVAVKAAKEAVNRSYETTLREVPSRFQYDVSQRLLLGRLPQVCLYWHFCGRL